MISIYTLDEIKGLKNISKPLKDELLRYFQEIAEGIVGEAWQDYNLSEVGPILIVEYNDTIDVLDEYGLMQGNKSVPQALPEFVLKVTVGGIDMLKIIWVCNDSLGLSVYYLIGKFGEEFNQYINEFVID
ncbi:hypothetical protein ACXAT3_003873 [Clostridium sporogenes]